MPDGEIWIVDDDGGALRSMADLLESVGYRTKTFVNGADFIAQAPHGDCSCAVLDVRIGAESGLQLQRQLNTSGLSLPIIFVTGHGDVPMSVQAMKAGAVDFLQKPFREQELLDAISQALIRSEKLQAERELVKRLDERFQSLTRRERQVFQLIVGGLLNKQVAAKLEISEVMVKVHRASVTKKMGAGSLAELVRFSQKIDFDGARARSD